MFTKSVRIVSWESITQNHSKKRKWNREPLWWVFLCAVSKRAYVWSKGRLPCFQILVPRSKSVPRSLYHPQVWSLHLLEFHKFLRQPLTANLILLSKLVLQHYVGFHGRRTYDSRRFREILYVRQIDSRDERGKSQR